MILSVRIRRKPGLAAVLAALLLFSGCSDRVSEASESAAIAEARLAAGNLEEARENILLAIAARDDVAEYFILLGRIELQSQKLPSAFNAYSRALDLQADNLEVLQAIAELGLQTDRLSEASEAADRMLLLFPGSTRAMLVKGFLAIEDGRLDEVRRYASEIVALNPADEGGAILLARLQALEGKFHDAARTVLAARQAIGETEGLNATLLEVYRAQGNAAGMRAAFPRVIAMAGETFKYQSDFINFLYKTGDRPAARAELVKAIAARPNDRAMLASVSGIILEYDAAPFSPEQLDLFAAAGPRTTRLAIARFYFDSGQHALAQALAAPLAAEGVVEAEALMARITLATGDTRRADRMIAKVLASDPRNPDALIARAWRRLGAGDADGAIQDANLVVSDAPQEYEGYAALANAHLAKGGEVRARQIFERGIDSLPQSRLLAIRYEAFLRSLGDNLRVLSLYGDLAVAKPSSAQAWEDFARVCDEFGNRVCQDRIARGRASADRSFVIDELPGTPRARGLFARITPEQICRSAGGVCTDI